MIELSFLLNFIFENLDKNFCLRGSLLKGHLHWRHLSLAKPPAATTTYVMRDRSLMPPPGNTKGGLLFDWFGISCMTTDNFCFYLQNRLIQTSQTGGQKYSDTSSFSIPCPLQP